MDDYMQAGFIAMLRAIKTFRPEKGDLSFIRELQYYLLVEYRRIIQIRNVSDKENPWFDPAVDATSLNKAVPGKDGNSTELQDFLPDEKAEDPFDEIVDHLAVRQDMAVVKEQASQCLTDTQRDSLFEYFLSGKSHDEIGQNLGVSAASVGIAVHRALCILREIPGIQKLSPNYLDSRTNFFHGKGIAAFQSSGTSTVEDAVERRETLAERYIQNHHCALNKEQLTKILELKENGASCVQIARSFPLSSHAIGIVIQSTLGLSHIKSPQKLSHETREKIFSLYEKGFSRHDVAAKLSVNYSIVCTTLKVRYKTEQTQVTDEMITQMIHLHEHGLSYPQIAEQLGISPSTVKKRMRAARLQDADAGTKPEMDPHVVIIICLLFKSGASLRKIGKRYGISPHTVVRLCQDVSAAQSISLM